MAKYKRIKIERAPSHPGEVLESVWLEELGHTQAEFAQLLVRASRNKVKLSSMKTKLSEVIKGKRAMSADFAVLISKVLKTNPKMWMSLQIQLEIWEAEKNAA